MINKLPQKCLFCDTRKRTKTHIWPEWLQKLLLPGNYRSVVIDTAQYISPPNLTFEREQASEQGSIFRLRPRLACERCNTGWMKFFEDEMVKFAKPLFTSYDSISLNKPQFMVMAGWISLVTILAEYVASKRVTIPQADRYFITKVRRPPNNWVIVVSSLQGHEWKAKYRHHILHATHVDSLSEHYAGFGKDRPNNTQISSFGMGNLFMQVLSCPRQDVVTAFELSAKASGLTQLWPIPLRVLPFMGSAVRFPTKRILNDENAEELSNQFYERLRVMTTQALYHDGRWLPP